MVPERKFADEARARGLDTDRKSEVSLVRADLANAQRRITSVFRVAVFGAVGDLAATGLLLLIVARVVSLWVRGAGPRRQRRLLGVVASRLRYVCIPMWRVTDELSRGGSNPMLEDTRALLGPDRPPPPGVTSPSAHPAPAAFGLDLARSKARR